MLADPIDSRDSDEVPRNGETGDRSPTLFPQNAAGGVQFQVRPDAIRDTISTVMKTLAEQMDMVVITAARHGHGTR